MPSRGTFLQAFRPCSLFLCTLTLEAPTRPSTRALSYHVSLVCECISHRTDTSSWAMLMQNFSVVVPIYVFYWKGPAIRERSKFAQTLAADREAVGGRRVSKADNLPFPKV